VSPRPPAVLRRLPPAARIGLLYTVLRLALFVLALGIGILVGLHGLVLVAVAFVASAVLSLPLGVRQREQLAALTRERIGRRRDQR
jgi:hypothetical protein